VAGVGFQELFLLFIIGLLILGPERLPRVAAQIGRWVGRARRTANQLRYQLEREIALADIEKSTRPKQKEEKEKQQERESAAGPDSDTIRQPDATAERGSDAPDTPEPSEATGADAAQEVSASDKEASESDKVRQA
jgi:sec-independent protein translocase protein TatB